MLHLRPILLLNLPGISPALLREHTELAPNLNALLAAGPERIVVPPAALSAASLQASFLTASLPWVHGVLDASDAPNAPLFWDYAPWRGERVISVHWTVAGVNRGGWSEADGRSGQRTLDLLASAGREWDLAAVRLSGLLQAGLADGLASIAFQHRLARFDELVGELDRSACELGVLLVIVADAALMLAAGHVGSELLQAHGIELVRSHGSLALVQAKGGPEELEALLRAPELAGTRVLHGPALDELGLYPAGRAPDGVVLRLATRQSLAARDVSALVSDDRTPIAECGVLLLAGVSEGLSEVKARMGLLELGLYMADWAGS